MAIGGQKLVSVFGNEVQRGHEIDLGRPTFPDGLAFVAEQLVCAATADGILLVDLLAATSRTISDTSLPVGITVMGDDVVGIGPDGHFKAVDPDSRTVVVDIALPEGGSALAMAMAPRRALPTEPSEPPTTSTSTQQPAQPTETQSPTATSADSSAVSPGDGGDTAAPPVDDLATTGAPVNTWTGLGLLLTAVGGLALWIYRARTRRA